MNRIDFPRCGWTGGAGMDGSIGSGDGGAVDKRWDSADAAEDVGATITPAAARLSVRPGLLAPLERGGTVRVLTLVGEADINTADLLRARLSRATCGGPEDPRAVVIDFSELTFLDSVALVALIDAQNQAKVGGVALVLAGARDQPERVFQMTKTGRLFATAATVAQALEQVGAVPGGDGAA